MGGRALKSPTTRLDAAAYHDMAARLAEDVARHFGVRTQVVKAYRAKPDFGDLDLVVERSGALAGDLDLPASRDRPNAPVPDSPVIGLLREYACRHHSRDVFRERNSLVFTFEHRASVHQEMGFQIDMILSHPQDFDVACDYYAYNDLGNLAGRLAHEMGCKYGFEGLHMGIAQGTQHLETLCLSKDTRAIHRVLDLDHARFEKGFDTLDEIFEFVMASKFFHPHLYKLENAGYKERARDRKRVNYSAFLDRCEQLEPTDYEPMGQQNAMDWLTGHFPDLPGRIEQVYGGERRRQELAAWFNGRNLGEWTGASGRELGALITRLREDAGDDATLMTWGPEEVRRRAMEITGSSGAAKGRTPARP